MNGPADLVRIARAHRHLVRACLLLIFGWSVPVAMFVVSALAPRSALGGPPPVSAGTLFVIGCCLCATTHVGAAYAMYKLLTAMGERGPDPWPGILGAAIPVINLFIIPAVVSESLRPIRRRGIRVPMLGLSNAQLLLLPTECCPICWYDMRGLTSAVCPECGSSMQRKSALRPPEEPQWP